MKVVGVQCFAPLQPRASQIIEEEMTTKLAGCCSTDYQASDTIRLRGQQQQQQQQQANHTAGSRHPV
jgi:predicted sulfurtransferase